MLAGVEPETEVWHYGDGSIGIRIVSAFYRVELVVMLSVLEVVANNSLATQQLENHLHKDFVRCLQN